MFGSIFFCIFGDLETRFFEALFFNLALELACVLLVLAPSLCGVPVLCASAIGTIVNAIDIAANTVKLNFAMVNSLPIKIRTS